MNVTNINTDKTLLVAAFDIGTSYSGYAYSFRNDFQDNPLNITTNTWQDTDAILLSHKAPSVILFKKDMSFHSFGYEAENKFATLAEEDEDRTWFYFKDFKMSLLNPELEHNTLIQDIHGHYFPVHGILTETIGYLRRHFLHSFTERNIDLEERDIRYIITVPAIWTDKAKQMMQSSARKAGINPDMLTLAYEPEAAAIYCRQLSAEKLEGVCSKNDSKELFTTNTTFMVVDLGGGTVDVTVQQITNSGRLSHVHVASGGYWGGSLANNKYVQLLKDVFTTDVFSQFCGQEMSDFLFTTRNFEVKKRVKQFFESKVVIRIPTSLLEIYKKLKPDVDVKMNIEASIYGDRVVMKKDRLHLDIGLFKSFFDESVTQTVGHLKDLFKKLECKRIHFMLLVGGFADCTLVKEAISHAFPSIKIIIPSQSDCGLAVLKGAVMYGHDPSIVESRICPLTYGIAVHKPYIDGIHDPSKSFHVDSRLRVEDCFEKLFTVNEVLAIGEKRIIQVHDRHTDNEGQTWRREHKEIEIYSTPSENPMYVTDPSCKLHGTILVPPPDGCWPSVVEGEVEVEVSDTQMIVRFVDKTSNHVVSGTVNFMPQSIE